MILTADKIIQLEILLTLGVGTKVQKDYLRKLSNEKVEEITVVLSELRYLSEVIDKEIEDRENFD